MKATIYRNFKNDGVKSLIVIAKEIAEGKYRSEIEYNRTLYAEGKQDEVDRCKAQLIAFAASGTFKEQRLASYLDEYNNFVHLDFDELTPEQLETAFKIIADIPHTFLCFRSPRGNGIKVFVEVNTGAEHHDTAYKQVQQYYEGRVGLKSDPKCKDITRLCFMSYDPQLHKNLNNQKFIVDIPVQDQLPEQPQLDTLQPDESESSEWKDILDECRQFTEQKKTYELHSRNDFIYLFASNANRKGVPHDVALQYCLDNYDLNEKEIRASFQSAYTHHKEEFAKFAKPANSANLTQGKQEMQHEPSEDYLKNTPTVPQELYEKMPDILREGAMVFHLERERDVFLTGALAVLSGCLPGVKGVYDGQEVFPNLYSFTIAPAASGKGALKFSKSLADVYHTTVFQRTRDDEEQYKTLMLEYKAQQRTKKKNDTTVEEPPEEPAFKVVFIPANTSYAKIIQHLMENEGFGIICETEADTMGNVFKQDWGGYSDMLRKAWHHERISSSRKADKEYIEVDFPRLSVAITGTPGQVIGIIISPEDGLFSRFLFYVFRVEQEWKDVSPKANRVNLTAHFRSLSERVYEMVQFLDQLETTIELTDPQWEQLNTTCADWLSHVTAFIAEDAASIVKRLGLVIYRLAMQFTAMRKFENGELASRLICTDEDFTTALRLAEIYKNHSLLMYKNLPKQSEQAQFKGFDDRMKFYDALPAEFKREEAMAVAKQLNIPERTAGDWLSKMQPRFLTQPKYAHYKKVK